VPNVFIQRRETKFAHITPCEAELIQSKCFLTTVHPYRAQEGTNKNCLDPWALVDDEDLELGKAAFGGEEFTSATHKKALSGKRRAGATHFNRTQVKSCIR
jgi:hypothetical protein